MPWKFCPQDLTQIAPSFKRILPPSKNKCKILNCLSNKLKQVVIKIRRPSTRLVAKCWREKELRHY